MAFEPNNYNISVFGLEGFSWVTFGLLNGVEHPITSPNGLLGTTQDTFRGLGSMGCSCEYFNQAQLIIRGRSNMDLRNGHVQLVTRLLQPWLQRLCPQLMNECGWKIVVDLLFLL